MNDLLWAWACITFWVGVARCAMRRIEIVVLNALLSLISRSSFWNFGCFSFRLWNSPWCVHIHATDPSLCTGLCVCFFLYCVKCQFQCQVRSNWQFSHSMRRDAGRGKSDGLKRLPISLGFKCANCRSEFDSRHAMNIHRRHISLVGTPCHGADPSNSKSILWTARGDHSAGMLRQHDTLGVLPKPAFFVCYPNRYFSAHFTYWE